MFLQRLSKALYENVLTLCYVLNVSVQLMVIFAAGSKFTQPVRSADKRSLAMKFS
jgi:hypothetical protein